MNSHAYDPIDFKGGSLTEYLLDSYIIPLGSFEKQGPLSSAPSPQFTLNNAFWKQKLVRELDMKHVNVAEFCFDLDGADSDVFDTWMGGVPYLPQNHPLRDSILPEAYFFAQFYFTESLKENLELDSLPGDVLQIYSASVGEWFGCAANIQLIWADREDYEAGYEEVKCNQISFCGYGHCIPNVDLAYSENNYREVESYFRNAGHPHEGLSPGFFISRNLKIGGLSALTGITPDYYGREGQIICGVYSVYSVSRELAERCRVPHLINIMGHLPMIWNLSSLVFRQLDTHLQICLVSKFTAVLVARFQSSR